VLFLPFVVILTGRWSMRHATEDGPQHERRVEQEPAAIGGNRS
jgi:hypothetical protein